jgi:D-3-phosphoglycerate dehydrogenase
MQEHYKKKLLFLEELYLKKDFLKELKKYYKITYFKKNILKLKNISNYDCIYSNFKNKLDRKIIKRAISLKTIVSNVTGEDCIDTDYAKKRKIKIFSLKGKKNFLKEISSTAEFTWGLILSITRKIPHSYNDFLKNQNISRYNYIGSNLSGKNIGFLGFGRNAKIMSRYAKAFRMKIFYNDVNKSSNKNCVYLSKKKLFKYSDILVVSISLNKSTYHIINRMLLSKSKKNMILVNTSRSELINQNHLLESLKNNRIYGAALDFLSKKIKDKSSGLKLIDYAKKNNNLIITPHLGGASIESLKLTQRYVFEQLIKYEKNLYKQ